MILLHIHSVTVTNLVIKETTLHLFCVGCKCVYTMQYAHAIHKSFLSTPPPIHNNPHRFKEAQWIQGKSITINSAAQLFACLLWKTVCGSQASISVSMCVCVCICWDVCMISQVYNTVCGSAVIRQREASGPEISQSILHHRSTGKVISLDY